MSATTIGILGGMGPRATVYFEQKLLDRLEGPDQSLPRIFTVNDGTIPDRTAFLCGSGEDPLPALLRSAQLLMQARPDIVCMPCNTAHASRVLGRLLTKIDLPVIDMPAAAIGAASSEGYKTLLVLGTEGTKLSGAYETRAGECTISYPSQRQQAKVNELIAGTKTFGYRAAYRDALASIIDESNCDAAILACTELSMLNRHLLANKPVIDALEMLVEQCIEYISGKYAINEA